MCIRDSFVWVRLNVADRSHRACIDTSADNGVEVLSFRHVVESRKVHCQTANRRRHRGKRNFLPKNGSRAVRALVPAQWSQFEVHALQGSEVVLERHAGTQSAYARKFPGACNAITLREMCIRDRSGALGASFRSLYDAVRRRG